jgi:hypothetical protein
MDAVWLLPIDFLDAAAVGQDRCRLGHVTGRSGWRVMSD